MQGGARTYGAAVVWVLIAFLAGVEGDGPAEGGRGEEGDAGEEHHRDYMHGVWAGRVMGIELVCCCRLLSLV